MRPITQFAASNSGRIKSVQLDENEGNKLAKIIQASKQERERESNNRERHSNDGRKQFYTNCSL